MKQAFVRTYIKRQRGGIDMTLFIMGLVAVSLCALVAQILSYSGSKGE
jgi:hypothetical protein